MNERVQELAKQALQLVADEHAGGDKSRLNTDSYHVKDLIHTKFAELIVRECIQTIQMGISRDGCDTEKYMRSMKHIKQIRDHFEVME